MRPPFAEWEMELSLDSSILDAIPSLVVAIDPQGVVLRFNHAAEQLTGYSRSEILGQPLWNFLARERVDAQQAWVAHGLLHGWVPPMESDLLSRQGCRQRMSWNLAICQSNGAADRCVVLTGTEVVRGVDELFHQQTEELARSKDELHRQKRLLELVLDSMGDGVASVDENHRFQLFTRAAERILGRPPRDLPRSEWPKYFGFHLPDQATLFPTNKLPLQRALAGESVDDAEIFVRNSIQPQGRWISVTSRPIIDEAGLLRGAVSVIHDLTERKLGKALLLESESHYQELAEHNRRLVRELEHRVRNNLAALLGLVSMMRHRAPDVDAFAEAIEGRLSAMAHVDHLLSRSNWQAVDLRSLIASSLATMQYMAPHVIAEATDGPDVQIPPRCVLPLTLILFEWFVNSCKHGAHHAGTGRLRVAWAMLDDPHRIRLTWEESGGPPVRLPVIPSLGMELVHAFATRELRGRCELNFPASGASHVLEFSVGSDPS
jgi:PAS domain S-box-containing protein